VLSLPTDDALNGLEFVKIDAANDLLLASNGLQVDDLNFRFLEFESDFRARGLSRNLQRDFVASVGERGPDYRFRDFRFSFV